MKRFLAFRNVPGVGIVILTVILLLKAFCIHAAAGAIPTIQLNGTDHIDALSSQSTLSLTIELDAGDQIGENAEWWIVAETPMGWFSHIYPDTWAHSGEDGADPAPAYEGQLFDLAQPLEVLNITGLPTGDYAFYFAVDVKVDGLLDLSAVSYDAATVQVVEAVAKSGAYPVVDTGQDACYDDYGSISCPGVNEIFYGQDAQYAGNQPNYTVSQNDLTVNDNVTGLTWTRKADWNEDGTVDVDDKFTYAEAQDYVNTLNARNYGGFSDWRVPTIKELYSLIGFYGVDASAYEGTDTSILTPFIDTDYFDFDYGDQTAGDRIIDSQWVTTTLYVGKVMNNQTAMFGVNFADGRIKGYPTSKDFYARFCRGNTGYGTNSFTDNGDGTVTDGTTGLMWSRDDSGKGLNWEEALNWVVTQNGENYLGYSDWRLPNAKGLQGIVDYSRAPDATNPVNRGPAIDPLFNTTSIINEEGETDYPFFWTGTTHVAWEDPSGRSANYIAFGRAMGYMNGAWVDVHGAGAQRSETKQGDPAAFPEGAGPQGDAVRIYNYVRLVRDAS